MQDPYLEYLMLTGGGGFGIPAVYSRISGIIMLVIGCVITVCIAAACCCCCALVRRANKYNNGQPQGYMQNLLHAASQRCVFTCASSLKCLMCSNLLVS